MEAELSDAEKGYAVYTRRTLSFYGRFVHGIANCLIWKCPTDELLDLYREHISTNHLEAGVGTGMLLENTLPDVDLRLALLDVNRDCLDFASSGCSPRQTSRRKEDRRFLLHRRRFGVTRRRWHRRSLRSVSCRVLRRVCSHCKLCFAIGFAQSCR